MDISMDIHVKSVDMDMDMDVKFHQRQACEASRGHARTSQNIDVDAIHAGQLVKRSRCDT